MVCSKAAAVCLLLTMTSVSVSAASSATITSSHQIAIPPSSLSSVEPRRNIRTRTTSSSPNAGITTRWLTYACGSHDDINNNGSGGGGGNNRSLLQRILTHPCSSHSRQSTNTANSFYNNNTSHNKGSSTFLTVLTGILSAILTMFIFLFIIDRETFTDVTGIKGVNWYCNPKCTKRRINDADEEQQQQGVGESSSSDDYTNFERDAYLAQDTIEYIEDKKTFSDRKLRRIFWCCFKTKNYTGDKYQVPWTESSDDDGGVVAAAGNKNTSLLGSESIKKLGLLDPKLSKACGEGTEQVVTAGNAFLKYAEELRLRLCWRPTKRYNPNVDKYKTGQSFAEGDIKYAASSYESAGPDEAPW